MQERSGPLCQGMGTFFRFSCSRGVGKGAEVGVGKEAEVGVGKGAEAGVGKGAEVGVGKGAEQSKKTLFLSHLINLPFSYNTFFLYILFYQST